MNNTIATRIRTRIEEIVNQEIRTNPDFRNVRLATCKYTFSVNELGIKINLADISISSVVTGEVTDHLVKTGYAPFGTKVVVDGVIYTVLESKTKNYIVSRDHDKQKFRARFTSCHLYIPPPQSPSPPQDISYQKYNPPALPGTIN